MLTWWLPACNSIFIVGGLGLLMFNNNIENDNSITVSLLLYSSAKSPALQDNLIDHCFTLCNDI